MSIETRTGVKLNPGQLSALAALASGMIPPDERDGGASSVNAGPRLAEKIQAGANAALYRQGLELAEVVAQERFCRPAGELSAAEIGELIAALRERLPGFFKQLRMDVAALYLSDPAVWQRIGFPGRSTASGGYSDFDQPQTERMTRLKEP
jgi:hypothetical protein